jgi:phosphoglycolate phosphatase
MIKYTLFDFDGTLVDSREVFIKSFNQLAAKYKFKKIEEANMEMLKDLSMMERLRFLHVPVYRLPFLTGKFLGLYKLEIGSVAFMPGIPELLNKISALGLETGILSSNSTTTIKVFLEGKGIAGISDVYCSGKLFGKDRVFRKFLKDKKLTADEVLYVCDELRDVEACNKAGIKSIWVSWGFEKEDAVSKGFDLCIAHSPEQLLEIIEREYLKIS